MRRLLVLSFLLICAGIAGACQTANTPGPDSLAHDSTLPPPKEFILKPILGLGTGVFTFYGDVNNKRLVLPQTSRIGFELSLSQNLNSYLNLRFYTMFGKLGANERSLNRNLNFESQIRMGGINLSYNFDQLLPKTRHVEPYITLGIESFEFLSKTDLFDANGNKYYFWSDGSIRNLDENDPNAANAIHLIRDYTYESDVREMNLDGFGKYAERSFAYTGGAGVTFLLHKQMTLRIGTAMHYTMTDFVDGVTEKSQGVRKGDSRNDMFLMTSFSLHYEFAEKNKKINPLDTTNFNDVDFFALDLLDNDSDGVADPKDSCQGTPKGVPVDAHGCPIDDDQDLVPNYLDDELNSAPNAIVDEHGVTMSDSLIALKYRMFMDSTGEFNDLVVLETRSAGGNNVVLVKREFTVFLSSFTSGVPPEMMDKLLTVPDVKSISLKDSVTAYTAGSFKKLDDAENRAKELRAAGFKDAKVVYKEKNKLIPVGSNNSSNNSNNNNNNSNNKNNNNNNNNTNNNNNNTNNNNNNTNNNNTNNNNTNNNNTNNNNTNNNISGHDINVAGLIFRVQVGAFKKQIGRAAFNEVPDLIELKTEGGLYKYLTGSYKDVEDAKKLRRSLMMIGYDDAFVVAYQDGKRVPLDKVGVDPNSFNTDPNNQADKQVSFKIQVGVFSKEPPDDIKEKFSKLKDLSAQPTGNGQTKYFVGPYKDYQTAQNMKNELIKTYGLSDSFIQAFHKGQPVSIQEALDILKE